MSDAFYDPDEWWKAAPDYGPPQNGQPARITIRPKNNMADLLTNDTGNAGDPNALQTLVKPTPGTAEAAPNALAQRGVIDQLFGISGPRYQTWPERMIRSGATLPGDVLSGAQPVTDPSTGMPTDQLIERVQDLTGLIGSGSIPAASRGALGMVGGKLVQPAAEAAPAFYSGVERALSGINQKTATGEQWLNTLRNQPGVKPEELGWTGVDDFLTSKAGEKVSKDDLMKHVQENKTEIKEIEKKHGETVDRDDLDVRRQAEEEVREAYADDPSVLNDHELIQGMVDEHLDGLRGEFTDDTYSATRYHQYQLPGGDNYRELLLTLPEKTAKTASDADVKRFKELMRKDRSPAEHEEYLRLFDAFDGETLNPQPSKAAPINQNPVYRSSHWDEPNVLAHVRMNDRQIPTGETQYKLRNKTSGNTTKAFDSPEAAQAHLATLPESLRPNLEVVPAGNKSLKSLHLEEVQSDWHQQGKKQGYRGKEPTAQEIEDKASSYFNNVVAKDQTHWGKISEAEKQKWRDEARAALKDPRTGAGVPDAPFKSTWADLALKRAISKAAREGYDAISWTPGEQQAAQYDLSKQLDSVNVIKRSNGNYDITGNSHSRGHNIGSDLPLDKISDYVGKDLAEKIAKQEDKYKEYKGVDLKVGGEGMKAFYDKMLVDKANKLAKSMGGKVEWKDLPGSKEKWTSGELGDHQAYKDAGFSHYAASPGDFKHFKSKAELDEFLKSMSSIRVPVLRLTDKMKSAAATGFPLYAHGLPFTFTPVDHDPFKDQDK